MPQTLRGSFEQALRPLPSVVKGVQACRLPGLKCLKRCAAASSRHSGHCPLLLSAFKPATWLNARLWPQILRSFVLHDSIDWFRCENLSRKPYKHIISIYIYNIYIYMYIRTLERGVGGTRALVYIQVWNNWIWIGFLPGCWVPSAPWRVKSSVGSCQRRDPWSPTQNATGLTTARKNLAESHWKMIVEPVEPGISMGFLADFMTNVMDFQRIDWKEHLNTYKKPLRFLLA